MPDKLQNEQKGIPDPETLRVSNLDASISHHVDELGFRLVSIFPADSPRIAVLERNGKEIAVATGDIQPEDLRDLIEGSSGSKIDSGSPIEAFPSPILSQKAEWHSGRAGMLYRDLMPGRLGGAVIASHIRIPNGGPVPDYVHFHRIRFQFIYCLSGEARLVYQDQGDPFRFRAGDCVLQPPGIRHRVLECSDGFEVVELSSPAEHITFAEHEIGLPNGPSVDGRIYGGQRFKLSRAADAEWRANEGWLVRDTGLAEPSAGAVSVEVLKAAENGKVLSIEGSDEVVFGFAVRGDGRLETEEGRTFEIGDQDAFTLSTAYRAALESRTNTFEVLLARFPGVE